MFFSLLSSSNDDVTNAANGFQTPSRRNVATELLSPQSKMRHILANNDDESNKFVTGYYGSLEFIDEQSVFTEVFGPSPQMLASDPLDYDDLSDLKKLLQDYLDRCRLDAFLHSVKQDYVGDAAADQSLSNHEIGKKREEKPMHQSYALHDVTRGSRPFTPMRESQKKDQAIIGTNHT